MANGKKKQNKAPAGNPIQLILRNKRKSKKVANAKPAALKAEAIPAGVSYRTTTMPGQINQLGGGDRRIRVSHREMIGSVAGKNDWTVINEFNINPGLHQSFPWLSGIARQYESYRFVNLCYEFISAVGTSTPGRVSMALDFDASDGAPASAQDMMSYSGAAAGNVYSALELVAEKADLLKFGTQRYVRAGSLAANSDIKTYDVGKLFVAIYGTMAEMTSVGELYVNYTIDLMTPQVITGDDLARDRSKYLESTTATGTLPIKPFGNDFAMELGALPIEYNPIVGDFTITEPGSYLLDQYQEGTNFLAGLTPVATDPAKIIFNEAIRTVVGIGAGNITRSDRMDVLSTPAKFTWTYGGSPPATVSLTKLSIAPWKIL